MYRVIYINWVWPLNEFYFNDSSFSMCKCEIFFIQSVEITIARRDSDDPSNIKI